MMVVIGIIVSVVIQGMYPQADVNTNTTSICGLCADEECRHP